MSDYAEPVCPANNSSSRLTAVSLVFRPALLLQEFAGAVFYVLLKKGVTLLRV